MSVFSLSGIFIALTCGITSAIVLFKGYKKIHYVWSVFLISVLIWGIGCFFIGITKELNQSLFWWKFAYVGVIFIPPLLFHFTQIFLNKIKKYQIAINYVISVFFLIIMVFTDWFIVSLEYKFNEFYYLSQPSFLYTLFVIWFSIIFIYVLASSYRSYLKTSGIKKIQNKIFLIGISISVFGGLFDFLPVFNIDIYPFLNFTLPVGASIFVYAIMQYRFMDIRMLFSQILAPLFLFISFSQLFLLDIDNIYIKIIVFILTLIISLFLIYSVNQESRKIKKIEKLNFNLNKANVEIADKNKYLEELLNMKTEFLRVVNHQLNTPLSIMRNAFAMVQEKIITPEKGFFISNNGLKRISETISDFWEAYELEGVKMKMKKSETDIEKIIYSLIDEKKKLSLVIDRKLKINFIKAKFKIPHVYCDSRKVVHVLSNLLDNAVYYTNKGSITVSFEKDTKYLKIKVTDTGLGISNDNKATLFQKFSRGQGAINMRPDGSGLGLFIARKIIEGNNGQIGAESKGVGKGSTFYFTLPIYNKKFKKPI